MNILLGFVILIVGLLFAWWCVSGNRIREYKDTHGNTLPGSLSEKAIMEINALGIEPTDVFIVINEPRLENWGMGGLQKG